MSLIKTVAILLAAALANPLCCCHASVLGETASTSQSSEAEGHGCCTASPEAVAAEDDATSHSAEDCKHQVEKASLIAAQADLQDSILKPDAAPIATLLPDDSAISIRAASIALAAPPESCSRIPPTPITQTYCVYRL